jgi:hypothetical protein
MDLNKVTTYGDSKEFCVDTDLVNSTKITNDFYEIAAIYQHITGE